MATVFVPVIATSIQDGSGGLLAKGRVTMVPVTTSGRPISLNAGSGPIITRPVSFTVLNGAIISRVDGGPAQIALLSNIPKLVDIGYKLTILDEAGNAVQGPGYDFVEPALPSFNLDTYLPLNPPDAISFRIGPDGRSLNYRGPYDITQHYNRLDVVLAIAAQPLYTAVCLNDGNFSYGPYGEGVTPSPTAQWAILARDGVNGEVTNVALNAHLAGIQYAAGTNPQAPNALLTEQDASGNITRTINPDGSSSFPYGASAAGLQIGPGPSSQAGPLTIADLSGRPLLIFNTDGSVNFPGGIRGLPASTPAPSSPTSSGSAPAVVTAGAYDAAGTAYYSRVDANGQTQIYRYPVGGPEAQLTTGSNNSGLSLSNDGTVLTFTTDRNGGAPVTYRMSSCGVDQVPITVDPSLLLGILLHLQIIGQSLAVGYKSTPTLTITQPFNNVMPAPGGMRINPAYPSSDSAAYTSLIPMTELTDSVNNYGETVASACANQIVFLCLLAGIPLPQFTSTNCSVGGQSYDALKKGTYPYNYGLTQIQQVHAIAGGNHAVRAALLLHGQQDEVIATPAATYVRDIQQWQRDLQADAIAITGQQISVPFYLSQASEFTATDGGGKTTGVIDLAEMTLVKSNPGLYVGVAPQYPLPHIPDATHLTNVAEQQLGEKFGDVIFRTLFQRQSWRGVYPQRISRFGATVIVHFYVPQAPLVFDTKMVSQPSFVPGSLYGFEFYDGSGNPVAINAATLLPDGVSISLDLAAAPSTAAGPCHLGYATTAPVNSVPGPRGNLRDSDATPSCAGLTNAHYNWCFHFLEQC